ncbi:MBL fold metallo-hydrolase [Pseudonocardia sp. GCM10023141]|uniref:MBL fold metallo-hydrolase n=1 Tax=Pseudonocardia sp. GCM10023141 TaxID=3252653 RepID=UPI003608BD4A
MSRLEWKFGEVRVVQVTENVIPMPVEAIFPGRTVEQVLAHKDWLFPHFIDAEGQLLLHIQSLLVESAGTRIVVDTCFGPEPPEDFAIGAVPGTKFLDDIAAAGFEREGVDLVVCTHLHVDHVGWHSMREGDRWVPTFPNARYIVSAPALEVWQTHDPEETASHGRREALDTVLDAGLVDAVPVDHRLTPEVRLLSTPGHTTGHVAVLIESGGERALVTGDLSHHPVQWAERDWGQAADHDVAEAIRTREWIMEDYGDKDVTVIGSHYTGPVVGRLTKKDGGRFVAV